MGVRLNPIGGAGAMTGLVGRLASPRRTAANGTTMKMPIGSASEAGLANAVDYRKQQNHPEEAWARPQNAAYRPLGSTLQLAACEP